MDVFAELELMAQSVAKPTPSIEEEQPSSSDICRWQSLFNFSELQACSELTRHREDTFRFHLPDDHWELVRAEKVANGYDREAYEFELQRQRTSYPPASGGCALQKEIHAKHSDKASYLMMLGGPLDHPAIIQRAAKLSKLPKVVVGSGDGGKAQFARIDGDAKSEIHQWLRANETYRRYRPTFIRDKRAQKLFSSSSVAPTLGIDSTLPQHRLRDTDEISLPAQDQYPVWYFFYGTLADRACLSKVLELLDEDALVLKGATITRGILQLWGDKYKALVDGMEDDCITGVAFEVMSEEYEERLLSYETDEYEVVRCTISFDKTGKSVKGCTFRFVGDLGTALGAQQGM
ncbi:hypothetical protein MMC19_001719 [Ptychographa xylographoides]|nr:hypothetical protein [Ptychographa xylographoides]